MNNSRYGQLSNLNQLLELVLAHEGNYQELFYYICQKDLTASHSFEDF